MVGRFAIGNVATNLQFMFKLLQLVLQLWMIWVHDGQIVDPDASSGTLRRVFKRGLGVMVVGDTMDYSRRRLAISDHLIV
jgi:hypothetical protein